MPTTTKRRNEQYFLCLIMTLWIFISCNRVDGTSSDYFETDIINLDHLNYLCEDVVVEGDSVTIVHIYADYPEYNWVNADGEGIACVDDAARAVTVYLKYFELTGDEEALEKGKNLLKFLLVMQTEDGEFYNFINTDFSINRFGKTSLKSFNFWAARGYWAIAYGYYIFREEDKEFSRLLKKRFLQCKKPLRKLMTHYGKYIQSKGKKYPAWLFNTSGSDATSEFLLGMGYFFQVDEDAELKRIISRLVEGILEMQLDAGDAFPGAFLSWKDIWHAYANCQTQALASLGHLLEQESWFAAAEMEAKTFYPRLIDEGFLCSFEINELLNINKFPQIAYGIRPIVLGLIRLYERSGDKAYAYQAGFAATWFFGRNAANQPMFDVVTGRCFDGINDESSINLNSGAESTIEALMCLLEVASHKPVYERMGEWLKHNNGKSSSIK